MNHTHAFRPFCKTLSFLTHLPHYSQKPIQSNSARRALGDTKQSTASWKGPRSQDDFMMLDTCIVVDENDNIVGSSTKKECHVFRGDQDGILHRAFSVFLFDEQNRLLLQQRAPHKITFPEVWTNTCCSHPLYGVEPSEVDAPPAILEGTVAGVKTAANTQTRS